MTDQTPTPAPSLATRAAEATANGWTVLMGLLPSLNTVIPLLVAAMVGAGGAVGYQKLNAATPAGPILAADRPVLEPLRVMVQPLDPILVELAELKARIDKLTTLAEERLPAVKAPPAKRTKTARVLK
jgi:hypothetical protein